MKKVFARRLTEIRGTRSRAAFGQAVGVSEGAIRSYEKGTVPALDVAMRVAHVGGVSLDWLAGREDVLRNYTSEDVIVLDEQTHRIVMLAGALLNKIASKSKRILINADDLSDTFVEMLRFVLHDKANEEKIDNIVDFQMMKDAGK